MILCWRLAIDGTGERREIGGTVTVSSGARDRLERERSRKGSPPQGRNLRDESPEGERPGGIRYWLFSQVQATGGW